MRRRSSLAFTIALACVAACEARPPRAPEPHAGALDAARTGLHARARAGDLFLVDGTGAGYAIATGPDPAGHRPLRGAVVDVSVAPHDRGASDPLHYWRHGWRGTDDVLHPLVPSEVRIEGACARAEGAADGVKMRTVYCATTEGLVATTHADKLPDGAELADELSIGMSQSVLESDGGDWGGEQRTRFVAFSDDGGVGVILDAGHEVDVSRRKLRVASEWWATSMALRYGPGDARRVLRAVRGDALDAIATLGMPLTTDRVDLEGSFSLLTFGGRELFRGAAHGARTLRLPFALPVQLQLRDAGGIPLGAPTPLVGARMSPPPAPRATLDLAVVDGAGRPVAAHVILRGLSGTPDPAPKPGASGTVYAPNGQARVALPPGRYGVLATHGTTWEIATAEIAVKDGERAPLRMILRPSPMPEGWIGADFHLHAAPSSDSDVAIEERVIALACEGVDVAVATDHNAITDYAPVVKRLGLPLVTIRGDEITSVGRPMVGHFNAFPLPAPRGAPSDDVPPYFEVRPADVFASAHRMGARVVQANHPRMPPSIGYFDLVELDARTGRAGPKMSDDFEAIEVLNGFDIEAPEKMREVAMDLVTMARRGKMVAATGNSDSHQLHYEEAGFPRTFVRASASEPSVVDAVLRRETCASSGPLVVMEVEGKPQGSLISAKGAVRVRVRAWAPSWVPMERVEIWRGDEIAARLSVTNATSGLRLDETVTIDVSRDATIIAWAEADAPLPGVLPYPRARSIAVTSPVYVDADGDGKIAVAAR